ncbi:MAG: hypothetical protein ACI38U_16075 [Corynebacterium sp.]|nr:hypothetical protein [Corynebacterium sp. CNJ-954]
MTIDAEPPEAQIVAPVTTPAPVETGMPAGRSVERHRIPGPG